MLPSQQDLLDRILASPHFAHTLTLGKILRYVCEKTYFLNVGIYQDTFRLAPRGIGYFFFVRYRFQDRGRFS
jgi:hypothetical protein